MISSNMTRKKSLEIGLFLSKRLRFSIWIIKRPLPCALTIFLYLIAFPTVGFAEYRAFQLVIEDSGTKSKRVVQTTLDHLQYRDYYPVAVTERISIQDSWMCFGNTSDETPICPKPPSRTPSGTKNEANAGSIPSPSQAP